MSGAGIGSYHSTAVGWFLFMYIPLTERLLARAAARDGKHAPDGSVLVDIVGRS